MNEPKPLFENGKIPQARPQWTVVSSKMIQRNRMDSTSWQVITAYAVWETHVYVAEITIGLGGALAYSLNRNCEKLISNEGNSWYCHASFIEADKIVQKSIQKRFG